MLCLCLRLLLILTFQNNVSVVDLIGFVVQESLGTFFFAKVMLLVLSLMLMYLLLLLLADGANAA